MNTAVFSPLRDPTQNQLISPGQSFHVLFPCVLTIHIPAKHLFTNSTGRTVPSLWDSLHHRLLVPRLCSVPQLGLVLVPSVQLQAQLTTS